MVKMTFFHLKERGRKRKKQTYNEVSNDAGGNKVASIGGGKEVPQQGYQAYALRQGDEFGTSGKPQSRAGAPPNLEEAIEVGQAPYKAHPTGRKTLWKIPDPLQRIYLTIGLDEPGDPLRESLNLTSLWIEKSRVSFLMKDNGQRKEYAEPKLGSMDSITF